MKKMTIFSILFVAIKIYTFAQPKEALKFLNIQPKWHHYSGLQNNINFYDDKLWGAKKALILDDKVYFLTNVQGSSFVQGYLFEELNLNNGNILYENFYNTHVQNERKYAFAMKQEEKNINLLIFKENTRSLKSKPFIWGFSNIQTQKYCSATQNMCDSIVTDPLDSLNKITLSWGQSLFKINNNYLNVLQKKNYDSSKKINYAVFPKLSLDKNGHLIDSTAISIPFQYSIKEHFTREYANNHYFAYIRAFDKPNNEIKMAYFDENFDLKKVIDLNPKIPNNNGVYALSFYDEKNFIISNREELYDNNVLKYRTTFSHFNHEGMKLNEYILENEALTYYGEASCILQPSQKMLVMIHTIQNTKSTLGFYTPTNNNLPIKLKTVELSHSITSRSMHPMPNNHFIFQGHYTDSSQFNGINYPEYTFWSMFTPESIGFTTPTKDINLMSFSFYPNPTSNKITIKTDLDYDAIRVYSIEGKLMLQLERQDNTLDVSVLPSGMYLFELLKSNKAVTRKEKFVKMQ